MRRDNPKTHASVAALLPLVYLVGRLVGSAGYGNPASPMSALACLVDGNPAFFNLSQRIVIIREKPK